ncbi:MAG: N-acetyltransferase [Deltaproteobacteria bacterium]|nr:N-acetyltransferase [Deltaproteobacteria bacterium]
MAANEKQNSSAKSHRIKSTISRKKKITITKKRKQPHPKDHEKAFFVHPKSIIDKGAQIGLRTRIWAFAHVLNGAIIGSDCNICDCVFIENGVILGNHVTVKNGVQLYTGVTTEDYVFIGPNATFTNDLRPRVAHPVPLDQYAKTHLAYGTSIGANATIIAGNNIGRYALIGAGTVVTHDVPAYALIVGNPGRQIGWVCECSARLDNDYKCPKCLKRYGFTKSQTGLYELAT